MENSNNRDVHCPYDDHPHLTIIETFRNFFSDYMTEENQVLYEKLNEKLQNLFDLEAQSPGIYSGGEYGIHCSVCSYWYDGLIQNDGMPINGVEEFSRGSKYLASLCNCGWDGETIWGQSWNFSDEICPYDFPAVFYSVTEVHAWFVWALKKCMHFFPDHKERLTELMECHVDVDAALTLMQKKLSGEIPWEFGPARIHEPKMILWHERTKDKKMNDWIRQWI